MLTCLLALSIAAADPAPPLVREVDPIGITEPEARIVVVSGGISRGSYQAGQLWVLMEHLKREAAARDPGEAPLELVVVGASAGSINALIAASNLLIEPIWPEDRPLEASSFFRSWVPEGFHRSPESLDRWPEEAGPRTAMIHSGFLGESVDGNDALLRDPGHHPAWTGPVRLAMTTARRTADTGPAGVRRDLNESFGFEMLRHADGVVDIVPLRLTCPGAPDPVVGDRGTLSCEVEAATARPVRVAPGGPPLRLPYAEVGRLIAASSAVPLAFPPFVMDCATYLDWSLWPKAGCHASGGDRPVLMVDGGVLDGHPFRVGDRMSTAHHESRRARFFFLDPDLDGSAPEPPPSRTEGEATLRFFAEVVPTARAQSVTQFFQDHPHLYDQSTFLQAHTPPVGSYLGGFLAFYDQSFRVWDFYAGVHDGYANLVEHVARAEGVDCARYDLGRWRGPPGDPRCEALLPALDTAASPAFTVVHALLSRLPDLGGVDWPTLAKEVDAAFAPLTADDLFGASHVHEMGGDAKDYDPLAMLRNLRMLALLVSTRVLDAERRPEGYELEWFVTRLSSVLPCPGPRSCAPFWFVADDLGGSLPFAGQRRGAVRKANRVAARLARNPDRLADAFTLRQDGAFSVLFRRRLSWQLAQIHRYRLLGDHPLARAIPRTGRLVVAGPNHLLSWSTGTPTVPDAFGAFGLSWDAWRVRPWSAFGRRLPLPWVYGGARIYGNPLRWWPGATPNAVLSLRAGVIPLQWRPGEKRWWVWSSPITPALGPMFPAALELGVLVQGAWVYGGADHLLIRPLVIAEGAPGWGATAALEARLHLLNLVGLGVEWHGLTRMLDHDPGLPGHQENPELRVIVSLTRPGGVRQRPYRSDW
ncbi:MAG: patatin-like phospholipase family protein [Alphaproteobacteria bacterium]|nr:patatin-like phospholipase family protein [Alphaproteobacteria bacterium]